MAETITRCVVGLGNPGRAYEQTRHNLGFWVVQALATAWKASGPRQGFYGLLWQAERTAGRVLLLEPQTFMNRSGQSVGELVRFYKISPQDVLVVLDDYALPAGRIRLRSSGSPGGHNGLTDVLSALGTQQVPRLRIGIGSPPPRMDPADYVLGKMSEDEQAAARLAVDQARQAVEDWLNLGIDAAMQRHNTAVE